MYGPLISPPPWWWWATIRREHHWYTAVIDADPAYVTPSTGGAPLTSTVTVSPTGGYTGHVALDSAIVTDANGDTVSSIGVSLSASSFSFASSPASQSCTASISVNGAPDGSYTATITGHDDSGNQQQTTIDIEVQASFNIWADPDEVTVPIGGSAGTTVYVEPVAGFTGGVSLTAQVYSGGAVATGVTASISGVSLDGSDTARR